MGRRISRCVAALTAVQLLPIAAPALRLGGSGPSWAMADATHANEVTAYGADPSGARDSTAAIQAAVNAVPPNGGKVRFPCGTYRVSSSITSTHGGLVIEGDGGSGWSSGSCVRIQAATPTLVFDFGSPSETEHRGVQVSGISVNDASAGGRAIGAFRLRRQNHAAFRNVAVNGFAAGYAFKLDGTGDAVIMTRFEGVTGRANKLGITTSGAVTSTYVSPNTFFAAPPRGVGGTIGVQLDDSSQMYGAVDDYQTCVRIVGDGNLVQARLEACALAVHVAGPTARRNIIMGTRFVAGGSDASVKIEASPRIYDTVIMGNTYAAPAVAIVDNSPPESDSYILEPQLNVFGVKRSQAGTMRWEVKNTRAAAGDAAEFKASAGNGAVQAVLRASVAESNVVQLGSSTDQNTDIIANGRPQLRVSRDAEIASGTTAVLLRVNRSGTTSLDPVTIGAPDSAGRGYRALRVRN